jgi:predicted transcriptional regulator
MELTEIQKQILRLYGHRHRVEKSELLSSQEVAKQLETTRDIINDELLKLEAMGLLKVQKVFGGYWSAYITAEGLIVLDEIGPVSDRE